VESGGGFVVTGGGGCCKVERETGMEGRVLCVATTCFVVGLYEENL